MLKRKRNEIREAGDPETKRSLIEAGARVFNRKSYLEATVDDITQEAGCARGTFYIYFQNKLDIFRAVCETLVEHSFTSMDAVREPDLFKRMVARIIAYLEVTKDNAILMRNFHMIASWNAGFAAVHGRMTAAAATQMRRHLERHMRAAGREQVDLGVASIAFGQLVEGFARLWLAEGNHLDGREPTIEEAAVTLAALIYRSVSLEPSDSREILGIAAPLSASLG